MDLPYLINGAFDLPTIEQRPQKLHAGRCVFSGRPISRGHSLQHIVKSSQGEFLETFGGDPHGYMSVEAARCWAASNPKNPHPLSTICSRSLAVVGRAGYLPLISRESATREGRPCWHDFVQNLWPQCAGEPCVFILSTDSKKRIWPLGRSGVLGNHTPILLYNQGLGILKNIYVDWAEMLDGLHFLSEIYTEGFSKGALHNGLFLESRKCRKVGLPKAAAWEAALVALRDEDFWPVILTIVQKKEL